MTDTCAVCGASYDPEGVVLRVLADLAVPTPDNTCLVCIQAGAQEGDPSTPAHPRDVATRKADDLIGQIAVSKHTGDTIDDDRQSNMYHHAKVASALAKSIGILAGTASKDMKIEEGTPKTIDMLGRWSGVWGGAIME